MVVLGLLASLVQLLILVGIIVFVVKAVSGRRQDKPSEVAPVTLKHLLVFGSLYAALHVAAWGVAGLIALLSEGSVARGERAAEPLAMAIVGVPILFFLGRWVLRGLSDTTEHGPAWSIYVNLALITALTVVVVTAIVTGNWLVGDAEFAALAPASLLVWSLIWLGHWWLWRTNRSGVSNLHVYLGATVGLGVMAGYGGALLTHIFERLLDAGSRVELGLETDAQVAAWVVALTVGAAVFAWHWVITGVREKRDVLWHSYVVLVGVLGGLITAVVGAGVSMFAVLQWWFGDPQFTSAVRHFADFIPAVTAFVIGGAVWLYHRRVLGPLVGDRTEVQRVYDYVLAAVGLVTAMVGVVILVIGFQEVVFPPEDSMVSEIEFFLGALTLLAVGVPLWGQAWWRIKRFSKAAPADELSSPTRRSYLFGIVGLGGVVAAVSLIFLLVTVFNDLLGEGGGRLRNDIQVPVALLFTVGAVAVYHLLVLREGQVDAPVAPLRKQVVLVTASEHLAGAVGELTGARITVLHRLDGNGEVADAGAVAAAVEAAEFTDLLVVAGAAGTVEVIPYRR